MDNVMTLDGGTGHCLARHWHRQPVEGTATGRRGNRQSLWRKSGEPCPGLRPAAIARKPLKLALKRRQFISSRAVLGPRSSASSRRSRSWGTRSASRGDHHQKRKRHEGRGACRRSHQAARRIDQEGRFRCWCQSSGRRLGHSRPARRGPAPILAKIAASFARSRPRTGPTSPRRGTKGRGDRGHGYNGRNRGLVANILASVQHIFFRRAGQGNQSLA
jgi:hypothetical protein